MVFDLHDKKHLSPTFTSVALPWLNHSVIHLQCFLFSGNKYFSYLKESDASNSLSFNDMLHYRQAAYLKTDSGFPVYKNTKSEFFSSGEAYFGAVLSELSKAQKYIFIEFFIIGEGYMWNEILKVLKEKSAAGVEIKIIFDVFNSK